MLSVGLLASSRVRRHYLTHPYNAEKRQAWERLGAAIAGILEAEPKVDRTSKRQPDVFPSKVIARTAALPA